jgi:putative membrane protein
VGWFGFDRMAATLGQVGWPGFALYTAIQVGMLVMLGLAWLILARVQDRHVAAWVPVWGRMVRDSAGRVLPFSTLGGFVVGARAVTLHGMATPLATASTIVDVTAEFMAQIAFALIGLLILVSRVPGSALVLPLTIMLVLAVLGAAGFVVTQRGASTLFRHLAARIGAKRLGFAAHQIDRLEASLDAIYAAPGRLALGSVLHLLGWLGTGVGTWLAYQLVSAPIDLPGAIAIEALLDVTLAIGFAVPAAAGVQEAAFAGIGGVFGLPVEASLAVSLLNRARDVVIGVPVLLVWQALEARRLAIARARGRA